MTGTRRNSTSVRRARVCTEEVFPQPAVLALPAVQTQLIGYCEMGLYHDYVKIKSMRANSNDFETTVQEATTEENLRRKFRLCFQSSGGGTSSDKRFEEHMEVGASRPRGCHRCGGGHRARDCPRRQVQAVSQAPGDRHSSIQCWRCRKVGHIRRDCRFRPQQQGNWRVPASLKPLVATRTEKFIRSI